MIEEHVKFETLFIEHYLEKRLGVSWLQRTLNCWSFQIHFTVIHLL